MTSSTRHGCGARRRLGTLCRQRGVASLALDLDRLPLSPLVHPMASPAVRSARSGLLQHELSVLARGILRQNRVRAFPHVAGTAQPRNFMRCGDAIRLTTPVGIGVAETLPMTDVAPDSLLGVRMCEEFVHGSTVADHAHRDARAEASCGAITIRIRAASPIASSRSPRVTHRRRARPRLSCCPSPSHQARLDRSQIRHAGQAHRNHELPSQ